MLPSPYHEDMAGMAQALADRPHPSNTALKCGSLGGSPDWVHESCVALKCPSHLYDMSSSPTWLERYTGSHQLQILHITEVPREPSILLESDKMRHASRHPLPAQVDAAVPDRGRPRGTPCQTGVQSHRGRSSTALGARRGWQ